MFRTPFKEKGHLFKKILSSIREFLCISDLKYLELHLHIFHIYFQSTRFYLNALNKIKVSFKFTIMPNEFYLFYLKWRLELCQIKNDIRLFHALHFKYLKILPLKICIQFLKWYNLIQFTTPKTNPMIWFKNLNFYITLLSYISSTSKLLNLQPRK